MKYFFILIITFSLKSFVFGQDDMNAGIIYGRNHAFSLSAPPEWILDNQSGVSQGIQAVFYKKGESWKTAEIVMYANTASLEDEAHKSLDQLIKFDVETFKKNYTDIKIIDGKSISLKEKSIAKVKYLSGNSYGNYEAIAYIDAGKTGVLIVMSSRTKEGFEKSLNALEALVKSYFFIADKVINEK